MPRASTSPTPTRRYTSSANSGMVPDRRRSLVVPCPLTWHSRRKPRLLRQRIGVAAGAATSAESHVNGHGTTSGALRQICVDTAAVRQQRGIEFPALGNQIPSRWESNSQPLGIVFPAAGNRCPKGCGNFVRGDRGGFPPPQKHVARPSSPAAKGRNLSQCVKNLSQFHKNLSQFHKILRRRGF